MIIKQDSRLGLHRITPTTVTPTIPASIDFTDGTWLTSDLGLGEIMFNMTDDKAWFRSDNGIIELATTSIVPNDETLYISTIQGNVANTTTQTSVFSGGVGSLTLPANSTTVGDVYHLKIYGYYLTPNTPTVVGTLTLRYKDNGTTIDTSVYSLPNLSGSVLPFEINHYMTIGAVGGPGVGSISNYSTIFMDVPLGGVGNVGSKSMFGDPMFHTKAFDTTIAHTFDVTGQWQTANLSSVFVQTSAIYKKYSV